jgi:hypothetical protein
MDQNLSQSSCEIITEIKNLEVCSENENFSSQFSEIAGEVAQLKVMSQESTADASGITVETPSESSTSSGSSSSSLSSSSSSTEPEQQTKRKRKRKRKRKTKTTTAYSPPKPFTARYKRLKLSGPTIPPKLHLRFNENDEPDQTTSDYNVKPRIILALRVNLMLSEETFKVEEDKTPPQTSEETAESSCKTEVFLKPRIIKAIVI